MAIDDLYSAEAQMRAIDLALDALPADEGRKIAENASKPSKLSTVKGGVIVPLEEPKVVIPKMYGAKDLAEMDIPPMKWVINGILPVGVTHFAGREKSFKSFAALGICNAVATGSEYMGFKIEKGESLYYDLESSERRPHDRLNLMAGKLQWSNDCLIVTSNNLVDDDGKMLTLDNGFAESLRAILDYDKKIRIVVIDVFKKIRSRRTRSEDMYTWDYRDVGILKAIADEYEVSIVLVNHTVKGKMYDNDFDMMRGAGINAAVDCIWLLQKDSEYSGTLKITGRDVETQEYAIHFDKDNFVWEKSRTAEEVIADNRHKQYEQSNIRQTLERITQYSVKWEGSPKQLISASFEAGTPIALEPTKLGYAFVEYEDLLRADGFTFTKKKSQYVNYVFINHNHSNN